MMYVHGFMSGSNGAKQRQLQCVDSGLDHLFEIIEKVINYGMGINKKRHHRIWDFHIV